jgi:hypothetical protein
MGEGEKGRIEGGSRRERRRVRELKGEGKGSGRKESRRGIESYASCPQTPGVPSENSTQVVGPCIST